MPDAISRIEDYKRKWRAFCGAMGDPPVSLSALLGELGDLFKDHSFAGINMFTAQADPSAWFPGAAYLDPENGGLTVATFEFKEVAQYGSLEDQVFWKARGAFESGARWDDPWWDLRQSTGFGACIRMDKVDWSAKYRGLADLQKKVRSTPYRVWVDEIAKDIVSTLGWFVEFQAICVCRKQNKSTEEVLDALAGAADGGGPESTSVALVAREASAAVRTGSTKIFYEYASPEGCPSSAIPWEFKDEALRSPVSTQPPSTAQ